MAPEYRNVYLKKGEEKRIMKGEVWVYDNELAGNIKKFSPGEVVKLYSGNDIYIATGFINPISTITFRVLEREESAVIDGAWITQRIIQADRQRLSIRPTNRYYRMVFSETDGLPGLVIDRFDDYFIIQVTTAGMEIFKEDIFSIIYERYPGSTIVERSLGSAREKDGLTPINRVISKDRSPVKTAEINGIRFKLDFLESQKTGFFLDQRDNYLLLQDICKDKHVFDVFSYAGAWGLHAYRAGAKKVEFLEVSKAYLEQTRENIQLNGFPIEDFTFIQADALQVLKKMSSAGPSKDIIILDPPAFIKSRNKTRQGISGYKEINLRAIQMVKPGGCLVSCSCSHFFSRDDFLQAIGQVARDARRKVKLVAFNHQPYDHPVLLPLFASEYLKCALFIVE